jgi:hypothetical protein
VRGFNYGVNPSFTMEVPSLAERLSRSCFPQCRRPRHGEGAMVTLVFPHWAHWVSLLVPACIFSVFFFLGLFRSVSRGCTRRVFSIRIFFPLTSIGFFTRASTSLRPQSTYLSHRGSPLILDVALLLTSCSAGHVQDRGRRGEPVVLSEVGVGW